MEKPFGTASSSDEYGFLSATDRDAKVTQAGEPGLEVIGSGSYVVRKTCFST